jgi:uncharacterized membrane protein (Fun14 family)
MPPDDIYYHIFGKKLTFVSAAPVEQQLQDGEFRWPKGIRSIKKVMKIAAVVIGLFVAGLAYLSYRGWVDVKWVAMEDASRSTLTNASEQIVHGLNNTVTQFAAHPSTLAASGLPIAATFGFVPGLMIGLRKG